MTLLEKTIASIKVPATLPASSAFSVLAVQDIRFGKLMTALLRYINITGERHPPLPQTSVVISCADHGVAAESVSAYPPETTLNMMCNYLIAHGGAANAAANYVNARLLIVDLGVNADTSAIPGLLHRSIARGTENMTKGPAMTRTQAVRAVETGIQIASDCAVRGDHCILPGEMGISNTTSSAAISAAILGLPPEEVTGRGANISDERLQHKIDIVRRALAVNHPDPRDGIDVLAKVGGFELGCIAGIILGAAAHRMLVILDGANTTSAALIARTIAPHCVHYLLASHVSLTEHSQPHALQRMGLPPMLRLDIRLSEAAGASIALRMLEQMLKVWKTIDTPVKMCDILPIPPQKTATEALPIPPPDSSVMDDAQYRLDNLAKPIHSLGYLERVAVQLAGITRQVCPPVDKKAALLIISDAEEMSPALCGIISAMTKGNGIDVYLLCTGTADTQDISTAARRIAAEHLLLILGSIGDHTAAVRAVLHAGAEGGALLLPGDAAADRIARDYSAEDAALRPYLLHVLPDMITAEIDAPAGIGGLLGLEIVRAALHVINDMKTFSEANVAVAIDGAGAGRQVREQ